MKPILEKVDVSDQEGIHAFMYDRPSFEQPWHFHPEYELTLIIESSGIRYVGNNISNYSKGDLVLLGSNLPHCWKNDDDSSSQCRSLVIQWKKEMISDLPIFEEIRTLLKNSQRGLFIQSDKKEQITSFMSEVIQNRHINRYLNFVTLLDFLIQNATFSPIAGHSYSYDLSNVTTLRLEQVQAFVEKNFKEKIKLIDVANQLNMSEQSFSRFFSKTMNKPFFEFLNEYRVNIASRLIFETDLQMSEIAYKCGYESLPFFYKKFKQFKGYTPLEFRKLYQKIN
ncbi:MAG: AraC family transcriptional regulator [Bacteroidota bacterium]